MKVIKYAIYTVLVLLALVLIGGAIFAMTFDPNRYKDDIERIVQERTGRTLKLSGDLAVAVWPSLGAKVGGVTLSERARGEQFLALESAHASVALMPLLRGEVIVDGISVAGLKAQVIKDKQGRFNFQDLLGEEKPAAQKPAPEPKAGGGGEPVRFDIAGVEIERVDICNAAGAVHGAADERKINLRRYPDGRIASDPSLADLRLRRRFPGSRPIQVDQ